MYNVEKHTNDFERAAQRVKLCDLDPLENRKTELWEESICGFHFRTVLYIGDAGHYFGSAASALLYLENERKKRSRRRFHENPVKQYYKE